MRTILGSRCRRTAAAVLIVTGLALLGSTSAQAGSGTLALCTVHLPDAEFVPAFTPFDLTVSAGLVTSNGPTGTVTCVGEVRGDVVTGAGTAAIQYTRHGNCLGHYSTDGTVVFEIPTTGGTKRLAGSLHVTRVGLALVTEQLFPDAHSNLVGFAIPLQGDCVLAPLSRVQVNVTGLLEGA